MSGPRFGYGTNGFANHRLEDALAVIAGLGYDGVALTLDPAHLDPYADDVPARTTAVARRLSELGLAVVVETGGRYVIDPWRKHQPTFLSDEGAERRVDYLLRAVQIGADLGAEAVSLWSGTPEPGLADDVAWDRLARGVDTVVAAAQRHGVVLGFEPEPGMLVETVAGVQRLRSRLGFPAALGITIDVGHLVCNEDERPEAVVAAAGDVIVNVQIDDMCRGVHEHLEFGTGEVDFPPVLSALAATGYSGLVSVELPRHSHAAPTVAEASLAFLREAAGRATLPEGAVT